MEASARSGCYWSTLSNSSSAEDLPFPLRRMKKKAAAPPPPAPPIGMRKRGYVVSCWTKLGAAFFAEVGGALAVTVKLSVFAGNPTWETAAVIRADPGLEGW